MQAMTHSIIQAPIEAVKAAFRVITEVADHAKHSTREKTPVSAPKADGPQLR